MIDAVAASGVLTDDIQTQVVQFSEGVIKSAIDLEILWNKLALKYRFSLLCGYAMGNFYKETERRTDVCALHTHVHD